MSTLIEEIGLILFALVAAVLIAAVLFVAVFTAVGV